MSGSPGTWFAGQSNPDAEMGPDENSWGTLAGVVAVLLLAPIAALVAILTFMAFQFLRISYKVLAVVTLGYWALMLILFRPITSIFDRYKEPYLLLFTDVQSREDGVNFDLGYWVASHAPMAIGLGLIFGTAYSYYRWIRRPVWEQRDFRATPWEWARRRKTIKKIAMDLDSPKDGVTVGVDPDGRRLVQTDREASAHTFVTGASGAGKALDVNTPIPLWNGGVAMMGDLMPGVKLFDENGDMCEVLAAFDVMYDHSCFEVVFSDGSRIVADEEHLWKVYLTGHNNDQDIEKVITTGELRWWHNSYRNTMGIVHVKGGFTGREVRSVVAVNPVESRPVRCISVDSPSRLFLAGAYGVPTHNTRTLLTQARDVIKRGHSYVYVDLKGGPDVPLALAEYAARYGRRFLHFAIQDSRLPYNGPADGPAYYDPAGRGDPSRRKDLLVGAKVWDVEYYKQVVANYLQTAFRVASIVPPAPGVGTFEDLVVLLQPDRLADRCSRIPTTHRDYPVLYGEVDRLVNGSEAQERSGVRSMLAYIQTFVGSTAGAWLRKDPNGERDIDFRRAADEGWVVCFSLDKANYAESSAAIAGLVVQDLNTMSSELRNNPPPLPMHIVFDEFQAIGSDNILGFIDTCRDAHMAVTMSTQALGNLNAIDESFADRVIGIVNCFIVHRANHMDDAEIFAGLTGMETKFKRTLDIEHRSAVLGGNVGLGAATGAGRIEEVDDYRVMPKEILELGVGELVYIAKSPEFRVVYPVLVVLEGPVIATPSVPSKSGGFLNRQKSPAPAPAPALPAGAVAVVEEPHDFAASYDPNDYWRADAPAAAEWADDESLNPQLGGAMRAAAAAPRVVPGSDTGQTVSMWGGSRPSLDETLAAMPDPSAVSAPPVPAPVPDRPASVSPLPPRPAPVPGGLPTRRPTPPASAPAPVPVQPARPGQPRPAATAGRPPAPVPVQRPATTSPGNPTPARRPVPPPPPPAGARPPAPRNGKAPAPGAQQQPAAGRGTSGTGGARTGADAVLDALGVPDPSGQD